MLKLMERRIKRLVIVQELIADALDLVLVLALPLDEGVHLGRQLGQVGFPPVDIFLCLHQEELLLLVVGRDCFREGVLAVLEHLDHKLQFLVELGQSIFLLLLELLLDFADMLLKHLSLVEAGLYFLRENVFLFDKRVNLNAPIFEAVRNSVALVISNDTLRADVDLVVLTEVLGLLLGMSEAEFVQEGLLWLFATLIADYLLSFLRSCHMHTWADSAKAVHFLFVINVV